jgi:hypothetical protein
LSRRVGDSASPIDSVSAAPVSRSGTVVARKSVSVKPAGTIIAPTMLLMVASSVALMFTERPNTFTVRAKPC